VTASDKDRTLRVLVIDEGIPYPPNAGKPLRTWNLLRRLAWRHSVCLVCYGRSDESGAAEVMKAGIDLRLVEPKDTPLGWKLYLQLFINIFSRFPFSVAKPYSRSFQDQVDALLKDKRWDLIQCEWTPYARFVSNHPQVPVLIATHNVESQIWARRAANAKNPFAKLFFRTQEWKMLKFERRALLRASAATVVSDLDFATIQNWGVTNVHLVTNGVDLDAYRPIAVAEHEDELLFLASLDWYPNADALHYFVENIFPIVRARRPNAILRIVGRKAPQSMIRQYSGLPGIDFVGEVAEVGSYLARAAVIVVPLKIGGGSRIKILEALAAGKAIVATTIGAEGLNVSSGEHLLIADSPSGFAAAIEDLLLSPSLRHRLGKNGRQLVSERYSWDRIADTLESVWYNLSEREVSVQNAPISLARTAAAQ
jgi:glycosyltransferase involved in cell wall biosynthesis